MKGEKKAAIAVAITVGVAFLGLIAFVSIRHINARVEAYQKRQECLNNISEIAKALKQYGGEFNDSYPWICSDAVESNNTTVFTSSTAPAASAPASQPASKPATLPVDLKSSKPRTGAGESGQQITAETVLVTYVGILLRSKDTAKQTVSSANLRNIGTMLKLYAEEHEKFPASLEELKTSLASPGDAKYKYAYVKGLTPGSPGTHILAYDPVTYGGKVVVLQVDGTVAIVDSEAAMKKRMEDQQK
ncbi:MAG: hypothetical protein HZA50_05990 [Planctomycetes bacterium]|nr:hypothetical protein [Planctomycetota bacterium]